MYGEGIKTRANPVFCHLVIRGCKGNYNSLYGQHGGGNGKVDFAGDFSGVKRHRMTHPRHPVLRERPRCEVTGVYTEPGKPQ